MPDRQYDRSTTFYLLTGGKFLPLEVDSNKLQKAYANTYFVADNALEIPAPTPQGLEEILLAK
jgi:hypothetical protein